MGQKVHPYGFRLGYIKDWQSNWYAKENYSRFLKEDLNIRNYIEKNLKNAAVARTEIQRTAGLVKVTVYTAKPGVAIGKKALELKKYVTTLRNSLLIT